MSRNEKHFTPTDKGIFFYRHGRAYREGPAPCKWKLCITATDEEYLSNLLYELSERPDCFYVKYSPCSSPKSREGMMLGRVFLTDKEQTGKLWAELYSDRKIMCSLQDDEAAGLFRKI